MIVRVNFACFLPYVAYVYSWLLSTYYVHFMQQEHAYIYIHGVGWMSLAPCSHDCTFRLCDVEADKFKMGGCGTVLTASNTQ